MTSTTTGVALLAMLIAIARGDDCCEVSFTNNIAQCLPLTCTSVDTLYISCPDDEKNSSTFVKKIDIPNIVSAERVIIKDCLASLDVSLPNLVHVTESAEFFYNSFNSISLPKLVSGGISVHNMRNIKSIDLPVLKTMTSIFYLTGLTNLQTFHVPLLETATVDSFEIMNSSLTTVEFPKLTKISGGFLQLSWNSLLTSASFPLLESVMPAGVGLYQNPSLKKVLFPVLKSVGATQARQLYFNVSDLESGGCVSLKCFDSVSAFSAPCQDKQLGIAPMCQNKETWKCSC